MGFSHVLKSGHLVCRPQGDLDEVLLADLTALAAGPQSAGAKGLILDLTETAYISSQGVAGLLKLQASLGARQCPLRLAAPSPLVRRILYQAGVAAAIPVFATVDAVFGDPA